MPPAQEHESLALPPPRELGLIAVAVAGAAGSGPLMAAAAAPALAIAFWRNGLGAVATGLQALRNPRQFAVVDRRAYLFATIGGLFLAAHFGTWVPSVKYTSVASATALVSTQAIFSALIAVVAGRRLPRQVWLGMVVAVVGVALIAGADFSVSGRALGGDLLALVGGAAAGAYVSAGVVSRRTMSVSAYTSVCYGVCAVGLLATCLLGRQPLYGYSTRAWFLIAAVTVVAQIIGHTLINVVLRSVSATFVGLALLFEAPGAAVIAYLWLDQTPSAWAVPGLVLLLGGLTLTVRAESGDPVSDVD